MQNRLISADYLCVVVALYCLGPFLVTDYRYNAMNVIDAGALYPEEIQAYVSSAQTTILGWCHRAAYASSFITAI
jgi:hypothetical protein